jgi:hypothetical protein
MPIELYDSDMQIRQLVVLANVPKDLRLLLKKTRRVAEYLVIFRDLNVDIKNLDDSIKFLRTIGRKKLVTFCKLEQFELVYDNSFYKPETDVNSDREWVWGYGTIEEGLPCPTFQFNINYRGFLPKQFRLKFMMIHPTTNNCFFELRQQFPKACFSEKKTYFDEIVRMLPGSNIFEISLNFKDVFIGDDLRPISFGLTDFQILNSTGSCASSEARYTSEFLLRKVVHSIGFEKVLILRFGQSFSTQPKSFEGEPELFWEKTSTKRSVGRRGLVLAMSANET